MLPRPQPLFAIKSPRIASVITKDHAEARLGNQHKTNIYGRERQRRDASRENRTVAGILDQPGRAHKHHARLKCRALSL